MTTESRVSNTATASVSGMNAELASADPALVGNDAILASVLQGSGDCIKILDLEGRLQFMSEGGKQVMEVDDFSLLKGCPWPDFWTGEGNGAAKRAIMDAASGKAARFAGIANTAKGTEKFWDVQVVPICGENGLPTHLLSISKDITERMDAQKRHELLNSELQHRMKNTLAMVSAIARQTLKGDDISDRREAFTGRLMALSEANDLITSKTWKSSSLRMVVEGALKPHLSNGHKAFISGPHIDLSAKRALSVALTIHELATNASKYGALLSEEGKIEVRWSIDDAAGSDEKCFTFVWREFGGPTVSMPTRSGFGSQLISRALAADFKGKVLLEYLETGVVCTMKADLTDYSTDS